MIQLIAALLLVASAWAPPAAAAGSPEDFVRETADRILVVLRDDAADSDAKRARIEKIVEETADIPTMGKLALARHWRSFSEPQREEYLREFRSYLSNTYGRNIDTYSDEKVEILGGREEARGDYTVQS